MFVQCQEMQKVYVDKMGENVFVLWQICSDALALFLVFETLGLHYNV